jgi:hypothetical protein
MFGQAAMEYLLMFSLVLSILTILTYYAQDMTVANREEIISSDVMIAVNKIAEASDIVYTQGNSSQITLSVYIPENLQSIQIGNLTPETFPNRMIIIKVRVGSGFTDIFASSMAPLQGSISTDFGTKRIKVRAIKANGAYYVNITQV